MARHADRILMTPEVFQLRAIQQLQLPHDIKGIPFHRLMLEAVVDFHPSVKMPTYNSYDIDSIFFGFSREYTYKLLHRIDPEEMAKHPWAVPMYSAGQRWTLFEVERLIHILFEMEMISYDRVVIALHIVCWTAKAYGLYV